MVNNKTFPKDFWNYRVNPITGWHDEARRNNQDDKVAKKYAKPNYGPIEKY